MVVVVVVMVVVVSLPVAVFGNLLLELWRCIGQTTRKMITQWKMKAGNDTDCPENYQRAFLNAFVVADSFTNKQALIALGLPRICRMCWGSCFDGIGWMRPAQLRANSYTSALCKGS